MFLPFKKVERKSFTLLESIITVVIIGILAFLALPLLNKTKEKTITKEAIANLKLIAAAEKIYRLETAVYYPSAGTEALANINTYLRLPITSQDWTYTVTGGNAGDDFTVTADRDSGSYASCIYTIDQSQDNPVPNPSCP